MSDDMSYSYENIKSTIQSAIDIARMMQSDSKKERAHAERVYKGSLVRKLNAYANEEEYLFDVDESFLSFSSNYTIFMDKGKYRDAEILATKYMPGFMRGFVSHVDF